MKLTAIITTLLYTSTTSSYVKADNNNSMQSPEALETLADQFKELAGILFATANEADTLSKYADQFTSAEIKDELERILDSTKVAEMLGDDVGDDAAVLFDSVTSRSSNNPSMATEEFATWGFPDWKSSVDNALSSAGRSTSTALDNAQKSTNNALNNAERSSRHAINKNTFFFQFRSDRRPRQFQIPGTRHRN